MVASNSTGKSEDGMRILITGANRGLGLEFVRQYLRRGEIVIATSRSLQTADALRVERERHESQLTLIELDVTDIKSVQSMRDQLEKSHDHLDLLINNAGVISGGPKRSYPLKELVDEDILSVFNINAVAPLRISAEFANMLAGSENSRIVNISSMLGSIGSRQGAAYYSYCSSKAALNMISKLLSLDLRADGINVVALHPGHVQTDMGGRSAALQPEDSIRGMIEVIDGLKPDDSGKFLDWQGREIPW